MIGGELCCEYDPAEPEIEWPVHAEIGNAGRHERHVAQTSGGDLFPGDCQMRGRNVAGGHLPERPAQEGRDPADAASKLKDMRQIGGTQAGPGQDRFQRPQFVFTRGEKTRRVLVEVLGKKGIGGQH